MFYANGTPVVITIKHPFGLWESVAPTVYGNVGIIVDDTMSYDDHYTIKDTKGNEFVYSVGEFRPASYGEIVAGFKYLLTK